MGDLATEVQFIMKLHATAIVAGGNCWMNTKN